MTNILTDEEIELMRGLESPITLENKEQLLATLDQRTKERDELSDKYQNSKSIVEIHLLVMWRESQQRTNESLLATLKKFEKERDELKRKVDELQKRNKINIGMMREWDGVNSELKRKVEELEYDGKLAQSRRNVIRASNKEIRELKEENAKLKESNAKMHEPFECIEGKGRYVCKWQDFKTNPTPQ